MIDGHCENADAEDLAGEKEAVPLEDVPSMDYKGPAQRIDVEVGCSWEQREIGLATVLGASYTTRRYGEAGARKHFDGDRQNCLKEEVHRGQRE
jgi:hypothetical protein